MVGSRHDRDRRRRRRARRRRRVDDPGAVGAAQAGRGRSPPATSTAVSTTLGWRLVNPRDAEGVDGLARRGQRAAAARSYGISRERQDAFAAALAPAGRPGLGRRLLRRPRGRRCRAPTSTATRAIRPGTHAGDAGRRCKPSFRPDGTITAGNASPLNDGASAVLLGSEPAAAAPRPRPAGPDRRPRGARRWSRSDFGYAPVEAAERALARAGIGWSDVGAVELNEAFAVQSLACLDAWDDRPRDRQHPRRRDRDRPPARRLRRPDPRHAGQGAAGERATAGASPRSASASARAWPSCSRT